MSIPLRCTVRACEQALTPEPTRLVCPRGHAFDLAREGYWNLLQPQDRKSSAAGDRAEATRARRAWLARGFADRLVLTLTAIVEKLPGVAIDVGCGEGTMTSRLLGPRGKTACGVELSAGAVALAARLAPGMTWIVANADRVLPFVDGAIDLALSVFGRRPGGELARVLRPGATLVCVVPGPDDLIELRAAASGEGSRRDRAEAVLAELGPRFALRERLRWRSVAHHERAALEDALAMAYRGARRSESARLRGVTELDVTLDAEILVVSTEGLR